MEIVKINLNNPEKQKLKHISKAFSEGKVIAYPTDTVYGLGCVATNEASIEKIYKIKKRKKDSPFIILVKSFCMAKKYAKISAKQDKFLRTIWPSRTSSEDVVRKAKNQPKTAILEARDNLPKTLIADNGSIAMRLPKNDFLSTILTKVDQPIISTSLNISNQSLLKKVDDIEKVFKSDRPDIVVDAGSLDSKKPSSILDIRDTDNIIKIR